MPAVAPSSQAILAAAQKLPTSPQVLVQLALLLLDVNSSLTPIAKLLKRDSALAARVLRISNSSSYGGNGRIASVDEAVSRVGFSEVYRLTGLASVAQMTTRTLPAYGITGVLVRDNTLFCAVACEAIARVARLDAQSAYTAGLMRSTGKLVINELVISSRDPILPFAPSSGPTMQEWEENWLGITNTEVAGVIMEGWGFPRAIIDTVREHYMLGKEQPKERLALPLYLAAGMAAANGFALPGERPYWTATPNQLAEVNMDSAMFAELTRAVLKAFEVMRASVS